jgi:5-formyltetrahydrofolate cyclo-ligase
MKFRGIVVNGVGVGAKFGIATANLSVEKTPSRMTEGVYFVQASFDTDTRNGLLHFGPRKTFGAESTVEIHLLDTDEDLYGKELEILILRRERDIEQFQNADALFTQVEKDIIRARKFFIRGSILQQWDEIGEGERERLREGTLEQIQENEVFQKAQNIYVYAPLEGEIFFVQKMCSTNKGKTFYFPRIHEGEMIFCVSKWGDLRPGKFGIFEPQKCTVSASQKPDLVFVPAVAVDARNHRLGRGGGFYDRFLKDFTGPTITVVPKFAVVETLPTEEHDRKVEEIIEV